MKWPLAWAKTADEAKELAEAVAEELSILRPIHVGRARLGTVRFSEQQLTSQLRRFIPTAYAVAEEWADGEVIVAVYYRGEVKDADLNAAREAMKTTVGWDWT